MLIQELPKSKNFDRGLSLEEIERNHPTVEEILQERKQMALASVEDYALTLGCVQVVDHKLYSIVIGNKLPGLADRYSYAVDLYCNKILVSSSRFYEETKLVDFKELSPEKILIPFEFLKEYVRELAELFLTLKWEAVIIEGVQECPQFVDYTNAFRTVGIAVPYNKGVMFGLSKDLS